jgi:hypothetical protein
MKNTQKYFENIVTNVFEQYKELVNGVDFFFNYTFLANY